jgi:hypothetical protein
MHDTGRTTQRGPRRNRTAHTADFRTCHGCCNPRALGLGHAPCSPNLFSADPRGRGSDTHRLLRRNPADRVRADMPHRQSASDSATVHIPPNSSSHFPFRSVGNPAIRPSGFQGSLVERGRIDRHTSKAHSLCSACEKRMVHAALLVGQTFEEFKTK